jgi:hypothetical protein
MYMSYKAFPAHQLCPLQQLLWCPVISTADLQQEGLLRLARTAAGGTTLGNPSTLSSGASGHRAAVPGYRHDSRLDPWLSAAANRCLAACSAACMGQAQQPADTLSMSQAPLRPAGSIHGGAK